MDLETMNSTLDKLNHIIDDCKEFKPEYNGKLLEEQLKMSFTMKTKHSNRKKITKHGKYSNNYRRGNLKGKTHGKQTRMG